MYLGRPVYSLAIVLFALLLFSGLGSLWSSRWALDVMPRYIRSFFVVLVVVMLLHPLVSHWVLNLTLGLGLGWRVLIAMLLLSLLGFLMGIPFPTGIRWAGRKQQGTVPWLWGVNGITSVLGSALATAIAIHIGFRATLLIASGIYGIAGILLNYDMQKTIRGELHPRE